MAKKKNISKEDLQNMYIRYVMEHDKQPNSVYNFCKVHNFEETLFYSYFGNLEALNQSIFESFFDQTKAVLENSAEYASFDNRSKLLSFYFTFFEVLTANRSYVTLTLSDYKNLQNIKSLVRLKTKFTDYIGSLNIEIPDLKQEKLEQIQTRSLKESAWLQLLFTIKFWLNDTSANLEKTDVFIEKSVNASFDLMDVKPVKSVLDFGKFLFKETFQMN